MIHSNEPPFRLRTCLGLLVFSTVVAACSPPEEKARVIHPDRVITHPQIKNIDSVVLDKNDLVYVSDIHSVKVFSDDGSLLRTIGAEGAGPGDFADEVLGLAINSRDQLLAVDRGNCRVQVFDLQGRLAQTFGNRGSGEGEFLDPQGITVDRYDLVYVTDKMRNDIQVFSPGGEFLYSFGSDLLKEPESMAIRNERLYVADEGNGRVQIFGMRGEPLESIPRSGNLVTPKFEADLDDVLPPTEEDLLYSRHFDGDIEGIVFDDESILYLLDEDAGKIVLLREGRVIGAFVSELPVASGDGIAVDHAYEWLYVVDQGNSRVQVFDLKKIRKRVAG